MDPNLIHVDWERTFEALVLIIVMAFVVADVDEDLDRVVDAQSCCGPLLPYVDSALNQIAGDPLRRAVRQRLESRRG